jgi:zinc protease
MEAQGGSNNAFTSENVTVYQDWIPAHELDLCSISKPTGSRNLSFDPKVVESERACVIRNAACRSRTATRDSSRTGAGHGVRRAPVSISDDRLAADIQSWKIEDLQKFFKTYYAPNNCTLVLAAT